MGRKKIEHYGWGGENEDFPVEDWQYGVRNGDTRLGYDDWVAHNLETAE